MSDFTPGPWRFERDTFDVEEGPVWVIEDVAGTNIIIAKLFADGTEVESLGVTAAEQEANARLIASAPELLAALEDTAIAVCDATCPTVWKTDGGRPHGPRCLASRAAIAKARGES